MLHLVDTHPATPPFKFPREDTGQGYGYGEQPEDLKRNPTTQRNQPFPDQPGHNPLLAMARLWQRIPPQQSRLVVRMQKVVRS